MEEEHIVDTSIYEEDGALPQFIEDLSLAEFELRDVINYLIENRELIRDGEIEKLEKRAQLVMDKIQVAKKRKELLAELQCFRDVLALHKKIIEEYDEPHH